LLCLVAVEQRRHALISALELVAPQLREDSVFVFVFVVLLVR
jgi:hypothetical protein